MPAKTVVFMGLKKFNGVVHRYLNSSEYVQMAGRAGRRGKDEKGTVLLFIRELRDLPSIGDLKSMIMHKGEMLCSKFRLTYNIILNLMTAEDINVLEMMRNSFGEHSKISEII